VARTEGRAAEDTFPTYFRANGYASLQKYADETGFRILSFEYLGQYPAYFTFNPLLFLLGTAYDKFITRYGFLKKLRGWILVVLKKQS
jgi:hypothetical protein